MALTPAQELRRELLFFALDSRDGIEAALETAMRLEAFVLHGQTADDTASRPGSGSARTEQAETAAAGQPQEASEPPQTADPSPSPVARARTTSRRRSPPPARRPEERAQREAEIASYIARNGVSQAPVTLETVANFVRERDYSVVRDDDGRYVVDGRKVFTPEELLAWANRMRRQLNRPPFPSRVLQAEAATGAQPADPDQHRPASSANGERATASGSYASPGSV